MASNIKSERPDGGYVKIWIAEKYNKDNLLSILDTIEANMEGATVHEMYTGDDDDEVSVSIVNEGDWE